jgi:tRNA-specific 2-thiouridylase
MSGGVDSSVSAALLVKKGYRVVGGFIKNWSDTKDLWTGECAWRGERRDALRVAAQLGIPLVTFDFENAYRDAVVAELFRGYEAGETPNPDVLCNEAIKFGLFLQEARKMGMEYVAMGHYARIVRDTPSGFPSSGGESVRLLRGVDPDKDQSYFLYRVPQDALRQTLFPIGDMKKPDVRALAAELDLPVADKADSQGICFIGKLDMPEFLRKKIPSKPGDIVDGEGNVIGTHEGLDVFTIGQRAGIKIASAAEPWYVADKDRAGNRLIVVRGAEHPRLFRTEAFVRDLHWTRGSLPSLPCRVAVQVRYRQEPTMATLEASKKTDELHLVFETPVKAVAPGQSAVFYDGEECLGGGVLTDI